MAWSQYLMKIPEDPMTRHFSTRYVAIDIDWTNTNNSSSVMLVEIGLAAGVRHTSSCSTTCERLTYVSMCT